MEKMIAGYLDFVRGDGDEAVTLTHVNEMLQRVAVSGQRQGFNVHVKADREIHAMLRPFAFERCIANLVNNAGRYGQQVWVEARSVDRMLEITVDDDGPGIPAASREDAFKPFTSLSGGGTGLGLAIARDIARAHGGDVFLEDSALGGLRARIRVPG
jgi:two-component system osmolarity sensor histidine kinase EnvZ